MAPQNNIERRAAKRLAAREGVNYTEALRRVRNSGLQPSDILAAISEPPKIIIGGISLAETTPYLGLTSEVNVSGVDAPHQQGKSGELSFSASLELILTEAFKSPR